MEKVIHKFKSFKEQEEFEKNYWLKASVDHKFETLEAIRNVYISTFHSEVKGIEKVVTKRNLYDDEDRLR